MTDETQAGGDHAPVLARLLRVLAAASGTTEPLYAVLRAILDETQADRGLLMVYDPEVLRFELGLTRAGHRLGESDFAVSTTIIERALERASPVVISDVAKELPPSVSASARDLALEGALCIPLCVDRRRPGAREGAPLPHVRNIVGVLYVDSTHPGHFRESDREFFESLADATVLALRARAQPRSTAGAAEAPRATESDLARRFPAIVTRDPGLSAVLGLAERVARAEANVLIRGESGTGKELVARAIHARSLRAQAPFEVLDGAAIAEDVATSELFGHERGAFTGAEEARAGIFERASGGVLLLDHVSELPLSVQGGLLRVLQEGEVRRLGSGRVRRVDVRILATTNRDLKASVERGEFRHDLLFRLAVVELKIPPLRDRGADVSLLVRHFLEKAARGGTPVPCEPEAMTRLLEHPWPGNVRELENVLAAAALESPESITRAVIDRILGAAAKEQGRGGTMEEIERRAIVERLELHDWNQVSAARSLGIDRNTLRRKIVRYGIVRGR